MLFFTETLLPRIQYFFIFTDVLSSLKICNSRKTITKTPVSVFQDFLTFADVCISKIVFSLGVVLSKRSEIVLFQIAEIQISVLWTYTEHMWTLMSIDGRKQLLANWRVISCSPSKTLQEIIHSTFIYFFRLKSWFFHITVRCFFFSFFLLTKIELCGAECSALPEKRTYNIVMY